MSEEFSPGLKIMLERIREFPEDFLSMHNGMLFSDKLSWESLVNEVMRENDTFTKEEQKAVRDALRGARRARFDGAVVELLAKKPEELIGYQEAMRLDSSGYLSVGTQTPKKMIFNRSQLEIAKRFANGTFKAEGGSV
jgi:hypothetical protein